MTALTLRLDLDQARERTRWTMTVSFMGHALLLLWIMLHRGAAPAIPPLTEITFLEPGSPASSPSSPAPPAAARETIQGLAARSNADVHFQRQASRSEIEPDPQKSWAFQDRLDARLAAMQTETQVTPRAVASTTPTKFFGSGVTPSTVPGGGIGTPVALSRGGGGSGAPLPLSHGGGMGGAPTLATVRGSGTGAATSAPARAGDSSARRTIAGASLMGPIADRPVLSYSVPIYPEWAKHDAVEGAVTLYFVVRPDGGVKENVLVQKTAGFEDFDDNARVAIRSWRFKALTGGQTGEQWGVITFHFRLRDAG